MTQHNVNSRIESELEIDTYLARIKYCLESGGCQITVKKERKSEQDKDIKYTNKYTLGQLFPNENPVDAMKRELAHLTKRLY